MLTVMRDIEAAPGGWRYTVPETGVTITGRYATSLRRNVRRHMEANGLDIPPDFEAVVNDAACRESGHGAPWCGQDKGPRQAAGAITNLTWGHVGQFLRAAAKAVTERRFVTRDEALRRTAVCMACPLATDMGRCSGCYGLTKILRVTDAVVDKFGVKVEQGKRSCAACGCYIGLKVVLDRKVLAAIDRTKKETPAYDSGCWMNEP